MHDNYVGKKTQQIRYLTGITYSGTICAQVIPLFLFPETDHLKTANTSLPVTDDLPKLACPGVLCSATFPTKMEQAAAAITQLVKLFCLTSLQDNLGRVFHRNITPPFYKPLKSSAFLVSPT